MHAMNPGRRNVTGGQETLPGHSKKLRFYSKYTGKPLVGYAHSHVT